jgi:hypothetical protein
LQAQHLAQFIEFILTGVLPSGRRTTSPLPGLEWVRDVLLNDDLWRGRTDLLPVAIHIIDSSRPQVIQEPINRLTEVFGSYNNPYPLTLIQAELNGMKGRLARLTDPVAIIDLNREIERAENGNDTAFAVLMGALTEVSFNLLEILNKADKYPRPTQ